MSHSSNKYAYFFICDNCRHRKSATIILHDNHYWEKKENPPEKLVREMHKKMYCKECGSKKITIERKRSISSPQEVYKATAANEDMVFHRSKCGWMNHVTRENEITFKTRRKALNSGYRPCKYCKP